MKKNFSLSVFLSMAVPILVLCLFSCKKENVKEASNPNRLLAERAAAANPTRLLPVNLRLTVSDVTENKIKSDGKGDYVNGVDGVSVSFDSYGNLQFSSNSNMTRKSGPAARILYFYFNDPLPETIPKTNPNGNYRLVTGAPSPIQSLPVGGSESGIGLHCGFVSQVAASTDWGCNFGYGMDDANENYVTVTHPDATHWIMTGEITNPAVYPVAALKTDRVLTGYYYMPFSFTFTSL